MKLPRRAKRIGRKATRPDPKVLAGAVLAGLAVGIAAAVAGMTKGPDALSALKERARVALEQRSP